jgi:mitogen-activated protein kinase kinase kinase
MRNYTGALDARRMSRTTSNASKRMSYITELRSRRDRSDTASFMTVDQITAEVESRRESTEVSGEDDWTKVESEDGADIEDLDATLADDDVPNEVSEDEDIDEPEKPRQYHKFLISPVPDLASLSGVKWIKGALIGAGSFGKVYLGMDASNGLLMAVKQVELPTGSAPNQERKKSMLSALEREIELLKDLQHENIVQYLCSFSRPLKQVSLTDHA